MPKKIDRISESDLYRLKISQAWIYFKSESFAFWMICGYLFFEYVRPQSIYPSIAFLPWTQITLLGAILGCFTDKTVRWVSAPTNVLLLLLLFVFFIASASAYRPDISYQYLENYYLWVIIYFLIINIVNTKKRFFIFISIFLVASFKISLALAIVWAKRGFSFTNWGLMGPPGFFQNSGELAIQMLVFWPISWAFIKLVKPYISKIWYLILLLMPISATMVILGASSRGAQLALVVQMIALNYRNIFRVKSIALLFVLFFSIWVFLPDEQKSRLENIGQDQTSIQRILYWERGAEMIASNPLLGVGFFNFSKYYEDHYYNDLLVENAELPHNIFIQIGTDSGLIGLMIFVIIIIYGFKWGAAGQLLSSCGCTSMKRLFNVSLVGYLVAGQFVSVAYYPFLWIHLALVVSLRNSLISSDKK